MRGEASRVSASYRLTPVSEGKSDSFQRTGSFFTVYGSFKQFIKKTLKMIQLLFYVIRHYMLPDISA